MCSASISGLTYRTSIMLLRDSKKKAWSGMTWEKESMSLISCAEMHYRRVRECKILGSVVGKA